MAAIDGQWESVVQSPMGEQRSTMTLTSKDDGSFVGVNSGALGSIDISDGQIDGDRVTFRMEVKIPFPMALTAKAALAGDTMTGTVAAGAFGEFPFEAMRKS